MSTFLGQNFTYFVKGTQYWKFDNMKVEVTGPARSFRLDWLKCGRDAKRTAKDPEYREQSASAAPSLVIIVIAVVGGVLLLVIGISVFVWRRNRSVNNGPVKVSVKPSSALYSPGLEEKGDQKFGYGKKTMFVTSAQEKLRVFRYSLQGKV